MNAVPRDAPTSPSLSEFLEAITSAPDLAKLTALIVNRFRHYCHFEQAAVVVKPMIGRVRVLGISNIKTVEQSSPYAVWLRRLTGELAQKPGRYVASDVADEGDWQKFAPAHLRYVPLNIRNGRCIGIFLFRTAPWSEQDERVAEFILRQASNRFAFLYRLDIEKYRLLSTRRNHAIAAALLVLALFPVSLSSVAPAEVVPLEPLTVASPIPGVIRKVLVRSNDPVSAGQVLLELDDVDQRSRVDIASQDLEVAEAELKRFSQLGFQDPTMRFRLSELEGTVQIRRLELERAQAELQRTKIRAERDGIAIVGDVLDWEGRPIQIGERIMQIGDPTRTALRIWVPAQDGPVLSPTTHGHLYLDSEPWTGRAVQVRYWTFEPEVTPLGVVAYRVHAEWEGAITQPRFGLRGTAHLDGTRLPLILYLLRRPIIFLRQTFAL